MVLWKTYHLALGLKDALDALSSLPGSARLIAGGTDLLLDLQQGRCPPVELLVDITQVPELRCLEVRGGSLFIGAAVPLRQLTESSLVEQHAPALQQACSLVGGPQVRNTATLGGNVAHALPAGDGSIALLALDAVAEIASTAGNRLAPIADLYQGPGKSALKPDQEILVGFYLPLRQAGESSAFRRVMRPQGVALPILNMAIWLRKYNGVFDDLRIALGPAGPVPYRAKEAETALIGKPLTEEAFESASRAIQEHAHFRSSPQRASAAYRQHLSKILFQETLLAAWEDADNGIHG